jgi:glycosyltransferase involved in cell wall biosynthesis
VAANQETTAQQPPPAQPIADLTAVIPTQRGARLPGSRGAGNQETTTRHPIAELTAVVPVRNGEQLLPDCLRSLLESGVGQLIVVDGRSTDRSREIAEQFGAVVLSDEGRGLPYARELGVREATTRRVVLVDVDVVFPPGALARLVDEFVEGGYTALQAGLFSVGGPGYWGQALANHHRTGRSRNWFGLVATMFERNELLRIGFDDQFRSGEDIELRWRLRNEGRRCEVSRRAVVVHRFAGDDFAFAKDQFLMDGAGLGRMVGKHRWRGAPLVLLPLAAAARGVVLSVLHGEPRWLPYYAGFACFNYYGMRQGLKDMRK